MIKYICTECDESKEMRRENWSYTVNHDSMTGICSACNQKIWDAQEKQKSYFTVIGDSSSLGIAGYNEGLGITIRDRSHMINVMNEKSNIKPAEDSPMNSML